MANGGSVIFKFEGDTKNLDKATGKTESALGTLAKSFTLANVASTALNKSIQLISSNLDAAISRYDTMNNFPKVMKSLGFETADAEKAVEDLSEGLEGLPTALDESISLVQRLTASNGDIKKSTKIYLAMNDAILAGGSSAQTQASALEQLTQAYSKGKFDAMEYRSILSAMPGQLKQVAQFLGYTSTAIEGDLYNALKDGTLSMDKFMDAFIQLDEKGSGSIKSFKEQARNATGGIATSMKNLKTAVVRSMTQIIDKIDDALKEFGGISGIIASMSKTIAKIIKKVGGFLVEVIKALIDIGKFLKPLLPLIEGVLAAFLAYKVITGIITGISKAMAVLNALMAVNLYILLAAAVAGLVVAMVALYDTYGKGTAEEKAEAERMKELAEQARETKKSFDDLTEAKNKQISEGLSELNHIQILADELRNLADAQGNVAEKDRARAEFILGELNNALGTEYSMIDGQIQKYNELTASIDQQIENKRKQIIFEAREEEYRKALAEWTDLQTQKEQARLDMEKAEADFREKENWRNAERLTEAIDRYNQYDTAIKDASIKIRTYEDAMTENLRGNTEEAKRLLMEKSLAFTDYKDVANLSQEEQTRILKEQLDRCNQYLEEYRQKYKKNVEGYTSDGLVEATQYADKAKKAYEQIGKNMNEGLDNGLNSTKGQVTNTFKRESEDFLSQVTLTFGINSPSRVLYGYGQNINQGLINGLNSNSGSAISTMGSIARSMLTRMKNILGIHSPSTMFRDEIGKNIALGIGVGFEDEMASVEKNMNKAVQNLIPEMSDVFGLSPTLNNTTSSNSNVNVTVYNNMETDFMGNLVNNIKSFSNGSKNDYNYGMT